MIKANELRIGNYVSLTNEAKEDFHNTIGEKINDYFSITNFVCDEVVLDGYDFTFEELEPIPLTEEWLLRFGFNTDSDCWYYYLDWSKNHETFKIAKDDFNNYFLVGQYSKGFKHVHQLQNLFYCLTNEELTLKD